MDRIEDFQAFVAIVERGSLSAAARQLGRSLQSVSRSLSALEAEIGVELIRRTTRRSAPTDAGIAFHRRLSAALDEIEAAKRETANRGAEATGLLRIAGSSIFGPLHIVPAVPAFLKDHPKVEIELDLSDGYVDLVGDSYDLAIRIGDLPDSALTARRLARSRHVTFAAPGYLAAHGRPLRPADLADHHCIVRTMARDGNLWPFRIDGKRQAVKVGGQFRTNTGMAANAAAANGLGVARAQLWQVRPLLERGALDLILTEFEPTPIAIHAVWPATRVLAARTKLFVDFLAARLKNEAL